MKNCLLRASAALFAMCGLISPVLAASPPAMPADWTTLVDPFRIVGNVYYVGTKGLAAYLITSGKQAVLLDGTLKVNAASVERSIRSLGFSLQDIKIIINSHAHFDHAGALAQLKHDSGAPLFASRGDLWALEHGKHEGDNAFAAYTFPPVKVDHIVSDGETIRLGDIRLTATLTPGHTKGCTTWSLPVFDGIRNLDVIFPCSISVAGNVLVGNKGYPDITADYERSFKILSDMKADVVLTNHPDVADVIEREARQKAGAEDAFVDPTLLQRIVAKSKADFETTLSRQKTD
jgi:metallo-beta-lactamase class B